MPRVPKLKVEITADDKLSKSLNRAVRGASRALRGIGSAASFAAKSVGLIGAAGAGAAYGVYRLTRSYSESVDALDEQAQSIGMSAQALREWQGVAERNGISADQLANAFGKMNVTVAQARLGTGALAGLLKKASPALLAQVQATKDNEEAQALLFEAARMLNNEEERALLVTTAFGKSGRLLIPTIKQGADAIDAQRADVKRLRGELSGPAIEAASDFEDQISRLTQAGLGLRDAIGSDLVRAATPALKSLTEWLVDERGNVAAKIATEIKNIATSLAAVDWKGVAGTMTEAASGMVSMLRVAVDAAKLLRGDTSGFDARAGGMDIPRHAVPLPARQQVPLSDFEQRLSPTEQHYRQVQRVVDKTPGSFIMGGVPEAITQSVGMTGIMRALALAAAPTTGQITIKVEAAAGTAIRSVKDKINGPVDFALEAATGTSMRY